MVNTHPGDWSGVTSGLAEQEEKDVRSDSGEVEEEMDVSKEELAALESLVLVLETEEATGMDAGGWIDRWFTGCMWV